MSNEMFSHTPDGGKADHHLHSETDEHCRAHARSAIARAVRDGMPLAQAQAAYGVPGVGQPEKPEKPSK